MKIVQLLPELNEGGVERGVVELNRELVKKGIKSLVISAGGRLKSQIEADGGQHFQFDVASKNPFSLPARIRGLGKILAQIQPDIIHARSRVPAWLAYLANRHLKIPFVTTVHGFNSVSPYSRVMTFGERVICVSEALKNFICENYSISEKKVVVIPRGVDLEVFDPNTLDTRFISGFIKTYQLDNKIIITTVGRITQLKDLETFIQGLVALRKRRENISGLIVGGVRHDKVKYFNQLKDLVTQLESNDFIHFVGSQEKVAEIYSISDVIVSSSKKPESFGRTAAESLAMGVPVAATAHGGLLDIVIPGKTGELFNPGDALGLSNAMESCLGLKRSGLRDFIRINFSLNQMVDSTLSLYHQLIKQKSHGKKI